MNEQLPIRKGRKVGQVLEGARKVFLRDGFEGASVDDIAREAGVSKATLYSYFPDKRLLFIEVASGQCRRQADEAMVAMDMSRPPREVLRLVATTFLDFIFSDMGQRIFRICVAESDRFPEIGQDFYRFGPMVLRAALVDYLGQACERGELKIDDLPLAADQFAELCKADLWPRLVFNVQSTVSQPEIDRIVDGALETFMARYGA
jgi:AcrR family transcriptional regulator